MKKMEDIMKKRLCESINKNAKIVLQNGYIYFGEITGVDEKYLEILDFKTNSYHIFNLDNIKDCEVKK